MKKYFLAAAVAALSLTQSASAATIANGSFEDTVISGSYQTLGTGSSLLTGWTVSGSIDFIHNYWMASDGAQSLDMNGSGAAGTISQLVTGLIVGHAYQILFDMSGNPDAGPAVKAMRVSLAGSGDYTYDVTGNSHAAMNWATNVFSFVATSASDTLSFASIGDPNGSWGPALDNVRIAAVPVPAGAPLLIGAIAALGALRRRRRAL